MLVAPLAGRSFEAAVHPGDTIRAEVEVLAAGEDEPITRLRAAVTKQDGVVVLAGEALVRTERL
jgi:acyl dehydratase